MILRYHVEKCFGCLAIRSAVNAAVTASQHYARQLVEAALQVCF